ncbi:hypothetical protein J6590_008936 [Homalodisca vitripennis]|nr:hypothetical protein J6590_008936 [Homalodisca vitripennis]
MVVRRGSRMEPIIKLIWVALMVRGSGSESKADRTGMLMGGEEARGIAVQLAVSTITAEPVVECVIYTSCGCGIADRWGGGQAPTAGVAWWFLANGR